MPAPPDAASARALTITGTALIVLGVLHTLATLGGGGEAVVEMILAGWWRTADITRAEPMRVAVFWSLQFGALLGLIGWLLRRAGLGRHGVSRAWAGTFGAVCLIGAVAVPVGGFWIGAGFAAWLGSRVDAA